MDETDAAERLLRVTGAGAPAPGSGHYPEGDCADQMIHLSRQHAPTKLYASLQRPAKCRADRVQELLLERRSSMNRAEQRLWRLNTMLLQAVHDGDVDETARLLQKGANANASCQLNKVSACHAAALVDNDCLSLLVGSGAETSRVDTFGRTPLHFAAWAGNPKQIAILLDLPPDLQKEILRNMSIETENEVRKLATSKRDLIRSSCGARSEPGLPADWRDSMEHNCVTTNKNLAAGWTALHCACARAQLASARLLLAAGAEARARDRRGRAPLDVVGAAHYSGSDIIEQNFRNIIELLAQAGSTINNFGMNGAERHDTPLHTAVVLHSELAIRHLLSIGASPTCLDSQGLSAMHLCVDKRLGRHLQLLANFEYEEQDPNAAIVDVVDASGLTVLHAAVLAGWAHGALIALGAGANVGIQANNGETPIHCAAAKGEIIILQGILAVARCAIDLQNKNGQSALFAAIIHNQLEVVKLLIENGASIEMKEPGYINALHVGAQHGHVSILQFLLDHVGEHTSLINERSKPACYPPIVYAVENNHPNCVKLLLDKRAQINIRVPWNDHTSGQEIWTTPLHIAAIKNHFAIATIMLLYDNTIINSVNSIGLQPLHEACVSANTDIITLFIHEGADLSAAHNKTKTPIQMLMDRLPNPTAYIEQVLDACIVSDGGTASSQVTVRFNVLLPNSSDGKQTKVINALLNTGNTRDQQRLLLHPLVEGFVYLKWRSLLPFFFFILVLYGLFVLSLNVYVVSVLFYEDKNKLDLTNRTIFPQDIYPHKPVPYFLQSNLWKYMIYVTVSLILVQEMFFFKLRTKRHYIFLETWVKFGVIALAIVLPSVLSWREPGGPAAPPRSPDWLRLLASAAVLLSWLQIMMLVARFPSWGYYALMLGNVTVKVFKILLTFGVLIIGFSLCFLIQFRAQSPFEGPWAAFTKTLVMMTSEYDYTSIINKQHARELDASIVVLRVTFVTFVVLASIVLMNLMVGVAVSDVNYLQKLGSRIRLSKQVEFLMLLEDVACCNLSFLRKTVDNEIVLNPSDATCAYNNILPKHIKRGLYEKTQLRVKLKDGAFESLAHSNKLEDIQRAIVQLDEQLQQLSRSNFK